MANEVQVFNFEQMNVRTVEIDDEVWFVAVDVAKALEIKNVSDALKRLDDDERGRFNLGRQGETNVISEAGLYRFIGGSRKKKLSNLCAG
ncbi:Bro-N domain-containing protein [Weissella paramesenteroides]